MAQLLDLSSRCFKVIVCADGDAKLVVSATTTPVIAFGPSAEGVGVLREGAVAYVEVESAVARGHPLRPSRPAG